MAERPPDRPDSDIMRALKKSLERTPRVANEPRTPRIPETPEKGELQREILQDEVLPPLVLPPRERSLWYRLWPVELWFENRKLFKEFMKHAIFFGLVLGGLEGFHRLLGMLSLPPEQLHFLDLFHFYSYVVVLAIFVFSFIMKLLYSEYRDMK